MSQRRNRMKARQFGQPSVSRYGSGPLASRRWLLNAHSSTGRPRMAKAPKTSHTVCALCKATLRCNHMLTAAQACVRLDTNPVDFSRYMYTRMHMHVQQLYTVCICRCRHTKWYLPVHTTYATPMYLPVHTTNATPMCTTCQSLNSIWARQSAAIADAPRPTRCALRAEGSASQCTQTTQHPRVLNQGLGSCYACQSAIIAAGLPRPTHCSLSLIP